MGHGCPPPPRSGWGGSWSRGWGGSSTGRPGPPPWLADLLGMGSPAHRGPKVRRGDVRAAILGVLADPPEGADELNGYQVIQVIGERSGDAWRPSPGSVYPTISQLQDEGLVATDDERGRRVLRLTDAGRAYCDAHPDELAAVWAPFETDQGTERTRRGSSPDYMALKPEIGQLMSAVWQIATQGTERQRAEAIEVLVEARRRLYGLLAEGDE